MEKKLFLWEALGAIFIIILGTLMHFIFEWFNRWTPLAAIAAVNESVWEHLKLTFYPALIWALIEYIPLKKYTNSFFTAKAVGLYIMPILIIILFYIYTGILGYNLLILDILVFIVSVIAGQYISYRLISANTASNLLNTISAALIIFAVLAFSFLTFYPPHIQLFKDPVTGGYGIVN